MFIRIDLLKNQKAFGIVEVLVAVGLMAIVSVGLMTMFSNANKMQKGVQAKDMQREVMAEIRTLLNNKTACLNSFGGGNPSAPFTVNDIKNSAGGNIFTVGNNDKSNLLRYTEFKIEDWVPDAGYTTQGTVSLTVALTKDGQVLGTREIKQKITLKIKRITAGAITECFSIGTNSDGLWQVSPANPSNIYYSAGNVGVGTNTPTAKLDVAGGVRLGDESLVSTCDDTNAGTLRYNKSSGFGTIEFCERGRPARTSGFTGRTVPAIPAQWKTLSNPQLYTRQTRTDLLIRSNQHPVVVVVSNPCPAGMMATGCSFIINSVWRDISIMSLMIDVSAPNPNTCRGVFNTPIEAGGTLTIFSQCASVYNSSN